MFLEKKRGDFSHLWREVGKGREDLSLCLIERNRLRSGSHWSITVVVVELIQTELFLLQSIIASDQTVVGFAGGEERIDRGRLDLVR